MENQRQLQIEAIEREALEDAECLMGNEQKKLDRSLAPLRRQIEKLTGQLEEKTRTGLREITERVGEYKHEARREVASLIIKEAGEDVRKMDQCSDLLNLEVSDLEKITVAVNKLGALPENEIETALGVIEALVPARNLAIIRRMIETGKRIYPISSYVAGTNSHSYQTCFLFSPIPQLVTRKSAAERDRTLAGRLYDKVFDVACTSPLLLHSDQQGTANGMSVAFETNLSDCKGYSIFALTLEGRSEGILAKFVDSLATKLEELQPRGFEEAGLVHNIVRVNYDVLNFLADAKSNTMPSRERTRRIYATNIGAEDIRELIKRQNEFRITDVAEVLGVNYTSTLRKIAGDAKNGIEPVIPHIERDGVVLISQEALKHYIDTHRQGNPGKDGQRRWYPVK